MDYGLAVSYLLVLALGYAAGSAIAYREITGTMKKLTELLQSRSISQIEIKPK